MLLTIIPVFHNSIIPCGVAYKRNAKNTSMNSNNYAISETLIFFPLTKRIEEDFFHLDRWPHRPPTHVPLRAL